MKKKAVSSRPFDKSLEGNNIMSFVSSILGAVQYPKNTLREYLSAFYNKCQADILSYLDGWVRTSRIHEEAEAEWVKASYSWLAKQLRYSKTSISTHLKNLVDMGVLLKRETTASFVVPKTKQAFKVNAYEYQISAAGLQKYIDQPIVPKPSPFRGVKNSDRRTKNTTTPYQNCDDLNLYLNQENLNTTTEESVVVPLKEEKRIKILPPPTRLVSKSETSLAASDNRNHSQINPDAEKIEALATAAIARPLEGKIKACVLRYTLAEVSTACKLLQQAKVKKAATPGEKINNPEGWLTDCLHKKYWCSGATDTTVEVAIASTPIVIEDDWVNDPRFDEWLNKAYFVGKIWTQYEPSEIEERTRFYRWFDLNNAHIAYSSRLTNAS